MRTFARRAGLTAIICVLAAPAHAIAAQITGEKRIGDRTITLTVATSAFAAPTNVDVILPTGYDATPGKRWPVTYVTAGTMNNYNSFRTVVQGVELTKDYPSIIVSPDGNSGYWSDWYNGGAFGPPKYETFVIDELLPLIDARFRTIPGRGRRLIFGISMGGYGTMMLAARHPDLFSAAASLSGADDSNNPLLAGALSGSSTFDGGEVDAIYGPRATQEVRWRGHNPTDLAENLRDVDLQVRTADGTLNPGIGENPASADLVSCVVEGGVHMGSVSLHERLAAIGKAHLWRDYGPGCHTVPNFKREIRDTLAVFRRLLAAPAPADPETVDHRAIEPHVDISGWHVDADPARALEFLHIRAGRDGVTLTGSGRTAVRTPAWYRGLRRVDVDGTPVRPRRDGRLAFSVDLGAAHTVQQYTQGAPTDVTTRSVALAPHAVLRLAAARTRRGIRVCLRAIGGSVPRAVVTAGAVRRRWAVGAVRRCRTLPTRGATRVTVRGRDRFGHVADTVAAVRR